MKRLISLLVIFAVMLSACGRAENSTESATVAETDTAEITGGIEPTEEPTEPSSHVTEPTEPVTEIGDYILDGTKLIGYIGNDTTLTLPEEVTGIAAYAFRDAPSAAQITGLHLGANVTEIEVGAFTGMHSLCTFTVDAQNPQFYAYEEHTLVSLDGTLYFAEIDETGEDFEFFFEGIIKEVEEGERSPDNFSRYVLGPAELAIEFYRDDPLDVGTNKYRCSIKSVAVYGYEYIFEEHALGTWWGNGCIQTVTGDDFFIVSETTCFNEDHYILIFTEKGIEVGNTDRFSGEDSNILSSYTYYRVPGDTQVYYKRSLHKFMFLHAVDSLLARCVSRDEFCYENGIVRAGEDGIEYVPIEIKTVSEVFDMEESFRIAQEYDVFSEYSTLDELLAANAEKYPRGY